MQSWSRRSHARNSGLLDLAVTRSCINLETFGCCCCCCRGCTTSEGCWLSGEAGDGEWAPAHLTAQRLWKTEGPNCPLPLQGPRQRWPERPSDPDLLIAPLSLPQSGQRCPDQHQHQPSRQPIISRNLGEAYLGSGS
jgi:hypothetical protein